MKRHMKKFGAIYSRSAWRRLMDSTQKTFSRGASSILKIIPWARGDNWRRNQNGPKKPKKQ